jgi:hypothetical protein
MDDMTITTPIPYLESFAWLPAERWIASQLLTDPVPQVSGKRYCKVCDAWVDPRDADKHASYHRRELAALKRKRATAAERARLQGLAAARREKKLVSA